METKVINIYQSPVVGYIGSMVAKLMGGYSAVFHGYLV